jgi:hypothetical protein
VLGHERHDAGVEQLQQAFDDHRADTRVAHRQRACAQQHHPSDDLGLDRRSNTGSVRADQRALELRAPLGRNRDVRERSEAGRDPIRGLVRRRDPCNGGSTGLHRGVRVVGQLDRRASSSNRDNVRTRHGRAGELDESFGGGHQGRA